MSDQLKMHSPNLVDSNIEKIAALFPNCVTEVKGEKGELKKAIDFDLLKQELSQVLVEGEQERYRLDWVGKKESILTANAPIAKTLRPCRDESVNFDKTENLFIEGDNLEALKLLQENYLGKVKMIYIDPPYNTGNDFIYEDDFAESTSVFFEKSNQVDDEGNRLIANTDSNGRFHSDWLSMMYSRLKLSNILLADDGIIAVSINDTELFQLGKIMDEIFGAEHKLACSPWLSEPSGGKEKTGLRTGHEYILIYYKSNSERITYQEKSTGELNLKDKFGKYRKGRELMKWGGTSLREDRPQQFYELTCPEGNGVFPYRNDGKEGHWRWGAKNSEILKAQNDFEYFHWEKRPFDKGIKVNGLSERWVPYEKIRDQKKNIGWSTWLDKYGSNADGTRSLKELFGYKIFDTPKPVELLEWIINLHEDDESLVLDFFAGSSATAHAVMKLNAEDFGNRKFIMVQLPQDTDENSEAYKNGYKNIAEISKERIRLAGEKIVKDNNDKKETENLDIGFRVLKIDSTNMKDVYYTPDAYKQVDILDLADHIKEDRTSEDLLFQVMLDWGLELSLPIEQKIIQGKEVFYVAGNSLVACFDEINFAMVDEIAQDKPLRVVSAERAIQLDHDKTNIKERFKQLSPETEVKFI